MAALAGMMAEARLLRLFTPAECQEMQSRADADIALKAVLLAAAWQVSAAAPDISCMYCGNGLKGLAAYVSIVVSNETPAPVPAWLAGICLGCGAARSRSDLEKYAQGYVRLTIGEVAGHG
jgi:hypothetical protein